MSIIGSFCFNLWHMMQVTEKTVRVDEGPADMRPNEGAFQGDMKLTEQQRMEIDAAIADAAANRKKRKAISYTSYRWPEKILPYEIKSSSGEYLLGIEHCINCQKPPGPRCIKLCRSFLWQKVRKLRQFFPTAIKICQTFSTAKKKNVWQKVSCNGAQEYEQLKAIWHILGV